MRAHGNCVERTQGVALRLNAGAPVARRSQAEPAAAARNCGDNLIGDDRRIFSQWAAMPVYVWPAYASTSAVLGGLRVLSWRRPRQRRRAGRLQQQLGRAMTRKQQRLACWRSAWQSRRGHLLVLTAFSDNLVFFYSPSELKTREVARIAGYGSAAWWRIAAPSRHRRARVVPRQRWRERRRGHLSGLLPDLFREGQGAVAEGKLRPDGVFAASSMLAKHDEDTCLAKSSTR